MAVHPTMPPAACKINLTVTTISVVANIVTSWAIALMRILYVVWFPSTMARNEHLVGLILNCLVLFMTIGYSWAWLWGPKPNRITDHF